MRTSLILALGVLAVGGSNLSLDAANAIVATGPWNDTAYPAPYTSAAGGGGGLSTIVSRPWWQPTQSYNTSKRMVPHIALFADESPGYAIICSTTVQDCGPSVRNGQSVAYVGATSAAAPLTAGMIALWTQQARQRVYDLATGLGSPVANLVAAALPGA